VSDASRKEGVDVFMHERLQCAGAVKHRGDEEVRLAIFLIGPMPALADASVVFGRGSLGREANGDVDFGQFVPNFAVFVAQDRRGSD
tara:strand:- start:1269 stop:1529 length:261 start_codon:yes stop_codon:yes gene_type:complete